MLKYVPAAIVAAFLISAAVAPLGAAPIEYHILTTPSNAAAPAGLFSGAKFDIVYRFDPSALTPTGTSSETHWAVSNTVASLKVTGTATLDGTYPAISLEYPYWEFRAGTSQSSIDFPTAVFAFDDFQLRMNAAVKLPKAFFGDETAPFAPKPFGVAEPISWGPIGYVSNDFRFVGSETSGYATLVPEPVAAPLLGGFATAIAASRLLSRRRHSPIG